ncbi:MAG: peptide deformylase [Parcubacteria group bacterium Athens1014_10]|nr:MAG: peptide deformylase [Parcubacteria group bacterium Athens1014_10]TSD05000.1 MAG: peptide deformylase [Parcubacteria group bacterium Athens0714_12]
MPILEIKKYPDPILKQKGEIVKKVNTEIKKLASKMLATMYQNQGLGLAAQQVGVAKRILVCDIGEGPLVLINPKICGKKGKVSMEEGCLSFSGLFVEVKRAKEVVVKFLDLEGKKIKIRAKDLLARVLQHEIDHLDGILFIDRVGFWKRRKILKIFKKK